MIYCFKEVKEEELVKFLLNPFERAFYFNDLLIQKFPRDPLLDDFFMSNTLLNNCQKVGHIVYNKEMVMVNHPNFLSQSILDHPAVKTIYEFKDSLREKIKVEIEKAKMKKTEEIKAWKQYQELYDYYNKVYFNSIVFSLLGTMDCNLTPTNKTDDAISNYLVHITSDNFISADTGQLDLINSFVEKILAEKNFIINEFVFPEIQKEAKAYVAAGKFSKRELILIDFLESIKAAKPKLLSIELKNGKKKMCKPKIDCDGILFNSNDVDIEEVEIASFLGKIIYTKKYA